MKGHMKTANSLSNNRYPLCISKALYLCHINIRQISIRINQYLSNIFIIFRNCCIIVTLVHVDSPIEDSSEVEEK